jgi:hypothetical protein
MIFSINAFHRTRRAAVRTFVYCGPRTCSVVTSKRNRKGLPDRDKSPWRRTSTGSNHISAFGVWRDRARRSVQRINRTGETRWHRLPLISQHEIYAKGLSCPTERN